jgi:peptide deformylase
VSLMRIRVLGDPVLRTPAADVEAFDRTLRHLAADMFETMYDAPGVGLAAPQVGLSIRFFVYDDGQGAKGVVANPVIASTQGEVLEEEGCLSVPGVYRETPRAERVRLSGRDLDGSPVELEGEGLLARIFQHETDHLNGSLYIDRLDEEVRRGVLAELRERELGGRQPAGRRFSGPARRP